VAIEHTDYFNDTFAGTRSPLTPIAEFWPTVQASLGHSKWSSHQQQRRATYAERELE